MSSVHVRPYPADIYRWTSSCPAVPLAGFDLVRPYRLAGLLAPRMEPLVLTPYLSIVLRAMRCDANAVRCDAVRCEYG